MPESLQHLQFAHPWLLVLLAVPAGLAVWLAVRRKSLYPTLRIPTLAGLRPHVRPLRGWIKQGLPVLRVLALVLMVIALARPQRAFSEEEVSTEGIDIVLAMDVSLSMKALDFAPDRLEAAKAKAIEFVGMRKNDRIGVVIFAGESFTQCPLTNDYILLSRVLQELREGFLEQGTAIGMGLATAVNRLKDSEAKSKVIVLLTDGVNNSGLIDPYSATEAAVAYGIRVYTIGVGRNGTAPFRVQNAFGDEFIQQQEVELDEDLLREIARRTGGQYFHAGNDRALDEVYTEIDRLEKSRLQVTRLSRKAEVFYPFLLAALALLLLELGLRYLVVRSIP
ncbi:MAG: VWA domain-containing protein [Bacteroidia bacterium]|nr:VWA domain-containing protein [Bacteroidia bacterium]